MVKTGFGERGHARAMSAAAVVAAASLDERFEAPHFRYDFELLRPRDPRAVIELRNEIECVRLAVSRYDDSRMVRRLIALQDELDAQPLEQVWRDSFVNTVVTSGADDLLTKYFAGSAYTAAWYMGLVDGASAPTIAAADTMASHAGWTENQNYSQANRITLGFGSAAARSISLSAAASYSINANSQTIAGAFFASNNTKGGTSGQLYSAGTFTGGNKACNNGDTLNVSASQAV